MSFQRVTFVTLAFTAFSAFALLLVILSNTVRIGLLTRIFKCENGRNDHLSERIFFNFTISNCLLELTRFESQYIGGPWPI